MTTEVQKEIEKYYDGYVERQQHVGVNARHHSIMEKLTKAGLNKSNTVLELGCGIGTFTSLLVDHIVTGNVFAVDISNASIEIAKKNVSKKNLKFIHADITNYEFEDKLKFDCIVLPDVLEHIPIELHYDLFQKLSKILDDNGFVFIHIPNPYYLQWCHENRPDLLQVIDQPITTDVLVQNSYPHGFFIQELKTYSIWVVDHDYQYIVLRKNGYQHFDNVKEDKITFWDKVKYKLNAMRK